MGSDGVLQQIAHHGGRARLRQTLQLRIYGAVSVRAVEIVGVDDAEGLVYDIAGTQHRVGRAEGLCPPRRLCIPRRQCRVVLIGVTDLHGPPVRRVQPGRHIAAQALHQLPHIRLDDEHDLVEPGAHRVIDAVLHQDLPVGAYAVRLLVAAVAGAEPRRHNDQSCFHALSSYYPPVCPPSDRRHICQYSTVSAALQPLSTHRTLKFSLISHFFGLFPIFLWIFLPVSLIIYVRDFPPARLRAGNRLVRSERSCQLPRR